MSGSVQSQLNAAFAQIGAIFGGAYTQYRPTGTMNPLATVFGTVIAGFDSTPLLTFRAPDKYGNELFYAAADPSLLAVGDYLVGAIGTLFVAGIEPNKPALCVRCNRVISILRPNANATVPSAPVFGVQPAYSGAGPTQTQSLLSGWPACVLQGTKGERGVAGLPDDTRLPWVQVLLPSVPGIVLLNNDQMTDDLGERFTISSREQTSLGWRLTAALAST